MVPLIPSLDSCLFKRMKWSVAHVSNAADKSKSVRIDLLPRYSDRSVPFIILKNAVFLLCGFYDRQIEKAEQAY